MLQSTSVGTNVPYADRLRLLKAKRETTNLSKKKYMSVKFENGTLVSRDAVEEWHPNNEKLKSSITKVSMIKCYLIISNLMFIHSRNFLHTTEYLFSVINL